jgi:UDP-glucuronate 4-epimerase
MKVLVTGAAGFIGYHLCESLLKKGHTVVGLDNLNDYYDPDLKYGRLAQLGIPREAAETQLQKSYSSLHGQRFSFVRIDLGDREQLPLLFAEEGFQVVCNLAAQAGVRYSLENPSAYVDSNIVGFVNLLECCRHHGIKHLVYASSSSVYGLNKKIPFATEDNVDHPISLYAATKKSNELMAHTYSHLFQLPTTGLRFFTVYGPWGRPDMALFLFTKAILDNQPINVFNNGELQRDFTYIDDIVEGVERVLLEPVEQRSKKTLYKLYNIGNNKSVKLTDFITAIEESVGKKAERKMLPMQPGDVANTWANVDSLIRDHGYKPDTDLKKGVAAFVTWYKDYYGIT